MAPPKSKVDLYAAATVALASSPSNSQRSLICDVTVLADPTVQFDSEASQTAA